jgi:serine O-acetyltransferase
VVKLGKQAKINFVIEDIYQDAKILQEHLGKGVWWSDPLWILGLQRCRQAVRGKIPGLSHILRVVQTAFYGIEIDARVRLGRGVWFIHPMGIVLGGDSIIGDGTRFFGSNTLGQAREDGYPVLGKDVWVGAGARILGKVRIGDRAMIAANAVVLQDVPEDMVAAGVPAKIYPKSAKMAEVMGHG